MREDILDEQRDLVESIEAAGWEVTETDLSVYESPWEDADDPEATVTLTARKVFEAGGDEENGDGGGDGNDPDDDNPYRVN